MAALLVAASVAASRFEFTSTTLTSKAGGPSICRFQCGYCEKFCLDWNAKATACCDGDHCCCCAPTIGPACTADQCLSTSKGNCAQDMCTGPIPPAPPAPPPAPVGSDGLSYVNTYRTANGQNALEECGATYQAMAQKICDYDAANGKHEWNKKNGYKGICSDPGVQAKVTYRVGAPEYIEVCESNGFNGGNNGATWENAVEAMKDGCTDAVMLDNHTCAAFGRCQDCTVSASGKKRNFYVINFC